MLAGNTFTTSGDRLSYEYDLGNNWQHELLCERFVNRIYHHLTRSVSAELVPARRKIVEEFRDTEICCAS